MALEEVASIDNLRKAFRQVRSNHGAPGPDGETVEDVERRLHKVLPSVRKALLDGTYQPGLIRRVWIPKPGGKGRRGLGIPDVIDRIVSQAVAQILTPHYDPKFHPSSHGFRPGRGCHTAIAEAKTYVEEGREWVVDLDLSNFFDGVNHQRLLARLGQDIKDARLLRLIRLLLKAKVVLPDGVVVSTEEGTPQGGPLSPLLSNIVLDELDWELARRGHRFVRYADDSNVYVYSERSGQRVMESITRFIEKRLRLQVNQEKSAVANPADRHFLGFRLCCSTETDTVEIHLSKRSRTRINERITQLTPRLWGQSVADCITGINEYVVGWLSHFHVCTEKGAEEFRPLDAHIRRRLRAIQLRHWKTKRTIIKCLVKLGIRKETAKRALGRNKGWWAMSVCIQVNQALRNAYFAKRGLVSIWDKWHAQHVERPLGLMQQSLQLE
jgi:group II intron reverse transcriptase/maturase